ncbi:MAG: HAMP domain-containing histidine kinase [Pirellulaceae bacterium]|nr:HAMP domain-containing histidine kinase [Pirellulaceae bacterium]
MNSSNAHQPSRHYLQVNVQPTSRVIATGQITTGTVQGRQPASCEPTIQVAGATESNSPGRRSLDNPLQGRLHAPHSALAPHLPHAARRSVEGRPQAHAEHPQPEPFLATASSHPDLSTCANPQPREIDFADQITSPLVAAQHILDALKTRVAYSGHLSREDSQYLSAANTQIQLVTQWAKQIAHFQPGSNSSSSPLIRRRFHPQNWRSVLARTFDTIADAKSVQLTWQGWNDDLPLLYTDYQRLSRALFHLLVGTVTSCRANDTISITAAWHHLQSQRLVISIEDQGPEMPSRLLKIANDTSEDVLELADSGLHIAKSLVRSLGGSLSAHICAGGGNVISLALPIDEVASLVRSWIFQNANRQTVVGPCRVSIYAVRATEQSTELLNAQLQSAADLRQIVYRVSSDRWIVIELKSSSIPPYSTVVNQVWQQSAQPMRDGVAPTNTPCACQCVLTSGSFALVKSATMDPMLSGLPQIIEQVSAAMRKLISGHKLLVENVELDQPATQAITRSTSVAAAQPSRGKIVRPDDAQPGAQVVSEIVKQWKVVQAKLARLNDKLPQ